MIKLSITVEETESGIACNIEGDPGEKVSGREFAFAKGVSDFVAANSKFIARISELEQERDSFGKRLAKLFKDAAQQVYMVDEEEFDRMVKDSNNIDELKKKLEDAKAKKTDEAPTSDEPTDKPAE